jgi:hypothetical protein
LASLFFLEVPPQELPTEEIEQDIIKQGQGVEGKKKGLTRGSALFQIIKENSSKPSVPDPTRFEPDVRPPERFQSKSTMKFEKRKSGVIFTFFQFDILPDGFTIPFS